MIIELIGLPAAGKSTFARKLSGLGKFKRIKISSRKELLLLNFQFLLRHPVKFLGLLYMYLRHAGPRSLWYIKFTSVFLDYNAKYMKAKKYKYALLDQGHMQVLLSLFDEILPKKKFVQVMSFLPKSDHYIFFDVDESIRKDRLLKREYVLRAEVFGQVRDHWIKTVHSHFKYLMEAKSVLAPATADVIDDSTEIDVLVDKYQNAQFMRYITFARMPTEKAHGLQIAKMCETFISQNVFVSLVTPRQSNYIKQTVTDFYKLASPVQHFHSPVFDVIGRAHRVKSMHHYTHELFFAWYVLWMRIPKELVVYTRTPLVSFVRGLRGNDVIAEQHFWPTKASWLHKTLLASSTLIPCNSDGTHMACVEQGLTQAIVAHNGFDSSILEEEITQEEARRGLGLPTEGKLVMYIGSLGDWKGVDTLCEAAESFQHGVRAVVIGGNEDELSSWKEKYPHVIFLGSKPYEEIGRHQRAADILIVPNNPISKESTDYTSPIKLFAHMASGVPLLVSDLPSLQAIVTEEEAAFFEAGNAQALCAAVLDMFSNTESARQISSKARDKANDYTWAKRAQNILNVYNKNII